ncbi:phage tail protein [Cronobacter sakazakii]|uniref:phage tail protein n=1 Tax=Cronobacter sakazakii TaxID=28141 RepID=UPI00029BA5C0|nr:phage tail protein [Cronobacter sakazakii]CCM44456.1 alternative bacteriophage tail fiber C-terminus [Cronobacter sakazakii 696]EGT5186463.1 phage tail protein [Cronobacter sakazakii]EJG0748359.1 tail fiber protein [Cronobacter sakazakii]ELY2536537.1 tail fiber protein [Cronobacter sakazakii]ELY2540598.1 tail fiber protein [Cronobacter sakazakii]
MANNEIKPFATGANANVTPQAEWENLPALLTGFSSGKASSAQVNKAIRQASFVAATLAQFIAEQSGEDVRDDGDQAGLVAKMLSAINKTSQPLDETLVALAALTTTANKLPYFTGNDTAAVTDLTAIGRNIIGKGSIADVLSYLGLGDGSSLPVGVPVPYPLAVPPAGWMKCNGSPFNLTSYPALAAVFPSGVLPDLRGEFIRGWDDGRGIDSGRALLSAQQGSLMALSVSANTDDDRISIMHIYSPPSYEALISGVGMDSMNGYQKVFGVNKLSSTLTAPDTTSPLGTTVTGNPAVGGVARPRNVSFNYIVRAA